MATKTGAIADVFKNSAPKSTYGKVFRNNLDEDSFHFNLKSTIQKLSEAEEALLINWYEIKEDKTFCQLEEIWITDFGYNSMALTKNLPYRGIINHALNEYIKNGQFQRSLQIWSPQSLLCTGTPFNDLGFQKVVFLFSILLFGMVLALAIFMFERRSYKSNPSKHSGSGSTLSINIKLNPDEIQRLINLVEEIGGQNHEFLVRKLQTIQSNPS